MEVGEYDINALLINDIASVVYRIYEPAPEQSHSFSSAAIELEKALRDEGHLVFYDTARRGIWHFQLREKDASGDTDDVSLDTSFEILGHTLNLVDEGAFEPSSIQKGRFQAPPSNSTPTSSSSISSGFDTLQRYGHASSQHASPRQASPQQAPQANGQDQDVQPNESFGAESKLHQPPYRIPYENFIASVLVSILTAFCPAIGAMPLNYRTVLLPSEQAGLNDGRSAITERDAALGTFGAYLTSTGSLIISLNVYHCDGLLSLDNMFAASFTSPGHSILAAPFGIMATTASTPLGDLGTASLVHTPNTQALSFRGFPDASEGVWRQACLRALQFRGILPSALEGCPWVNIAVPRRRFQESKNESKRSKDDSAVIISWPGPLCFRQKTLETSTTSRLDNFFLNGHEESHDPLGNAGRWLHSGGEREEQLSRRKADRSAPEPMEIESNGTQVPPTNAHTPLALGRPSTAAASAMYPTPPDGLQPPNGITPTFDGAVSSPRNPTSGVAPIDIDESGPEITNGDGDIWDGEEPKRERSDSKDLLGDAENMLMGGDMFGEENDITEADFNFFDEQPEELDLAMADVDVSENNAQAQPAPKLEEPANSNEPQPSVSPFQDSAVFMKPELKHARSLLNDSQVPRPASEKPSSVPKRESSPFNAETVFKRVRGANIEKSRSGLPPPRKNSIFDKVDIGSALPLINKKYEKGGFFDFDQRIIEDKRASTQNGVPPKTDYLKRHSKGNRRVKEPPLPSGSMMKRFTTLEAITSQPSPFKTVGSPSDDDQSSVASDQDDSSYTTEDPTSPVKSNFKRAPFDEDAASQVTSIRDTEAMDEPDQQLAMELPRLSKPEAPEMKLSKLFLDPEPLATDFSLTDEEVIDIAQMVTNQAATGTLNVASGHGVAQDYSIARDRRQILARHSRNSLEVLQSVIPLPLMRSMQSSLKSLLEVQDVAHPGQPSRLQPRPVPGRDSNSESLRPSNLYQIPCHHLEVRRSDSRLSILPSAVTFWESLGLAPASGSKDAYALCIFPGWSGMTDNVKTFLDRFKSLYELLRLGTFEKLTLSNEREAGLIPFEVDKISTSPDASVTGHGSALIESMEVLQTALSALSATETNVIMFMVYTPSNPGTIIEACFAFQRFYDSYWKPMSNKEHARNDLILQLVPSDLISSPTALVVTPAPELVRLCIETYDRCTSFNGPTTSPAIVLEQSLPRIIDFKLTNQPSSSLLHENACIHVAYTQSLDERWITAAWTDDRGCQQATAAYCMGRKGRPVSSSMHEIAHEIWESTLQMISWRKTHWRIIITKIGILDPQEVDFWADLAKTETKASISMILMTVDTSPALQLIPPAVQVPPSTAGFYTTPVSTPQATVVSPEQSNTPATPMRDPAATPGADSSGDPEADAALLDLTDQTWGAVLGHRLSVSPTLLELQPSLVSGYLIKRTSARQEDPPSVIEVNLVRTEATARAYEPLLREMLSSFRGLGTLARARGVTEREGDIRPWHIAAAEKACRALYMLL